LKEWGNAMAFKLGFCRWLHEYFHSKRETALNPTAAHLIHELVRQEVKAEFERRQRIEESIWADCFADGAAAEPSKQICRVMRLASARATLTILNDRK
jgi:hypothetical protein